MTKKDIVLKIADESKFKQVVVKKVVHRVFDVMLEALLKGDKIEIRNFGVFKVKKRKPRIGRNPRTNQPVPVPERKTVVFKPGLEMKARIK
jgi:nucleoid DNA-binding protein